MISNSQNNLYIYVTSAVIINVVILFVIIMKVLDMYKKQIYHIAHISETYTQSPEAFTRLKTSGLSHALFVRNSNILR